MTRSRAILALAALTAAGCARLGNVDQGRVVEYDASAGLMLVAVEEGKSSPPVFKTAPVPVRVPADPSEMGIAPEPGGLISIDRKARRLVVYNSASHALREVPYTAVEEHTNVSLADPRVQGKEFPIIGRDAGTITVFDRATGTLLTFSASPAQLSEPPQTWRAGDEVRYYYKEPGQALRVMNVTRTDIRRASH